MNTRWLLRMARWAHRPPSWERVMFMLAVVVLSLALYGYEKMLGWPEALTPDPAVTRVKK